MNRPSAAALLALVLAGACSAPSPAAPDDLTVFGAASLRDALDDVERTFEAGEGRRGLTIATDSSAALRVQIEQGAPADVFLSADVDNPAALVRSGLAAREIVFASNPLTIIVPLGSDTVETPRDLARAGVRIIAAADSVPVTRYAMQLLEQLAALDGYPASFVGDYERNVASREDNVRAVLTKIELGEGDAGIVYASDARASARVRTIEIPPVAKVTATYGAVAIRGPDEAAAAGFLDWLVGPDGRAILRRAGFQRPP